MPMKALLIVTVGWGLISTVFVPAVLSKAFKREITAEQKATSLKLSLATDKPRYKRGDRIKLEVTLLNDDGVKDLFVYGTLEFGYGGSFTLHHRDAKGGEVPTQFFPEAHTPVPALPDTSAFLKLLPNHFVGTYYAPSTKLLNMKPGKYTLWVEYSSPISGARVPVTPFWGSENGTLKSNIVRIEVVR